MVESTADKFDSADALDTGDQSHAILLPDTPRVRPASVDLASRQPTSDKDLFGKTGWFDVDAEERGGRIERYIYSNGFLLGYIPLCAVESQTWRTQFCCRDADLHLQGRAGFLDARKAFARQA